VGRPLQGCRGGSRSVAKVLHCEANLLVLRSPLFDPKFPGCSRVGTGHQLPVGSTVTSPAAIISESFGQQPYSAAQTPPDRVQSDRIRNAIRGRIEPTAAVAAERASGRDRLRAVRGIRPVAVTCEACPSTTALAVTYDRRRHLRPDWARPERAHQIDSGPGSPR